MQWSKNYCLEVPYLAQGYGLLLLEFEATIDHYAGDGLMAFFNDPIPCDDPAARAVRMAVSVDPRAADQIPSTKGALDG